MDDPPRRFRKGDLIKWDSDDITGDYVVLMLDDAPRSMSFGSDSWSAWNVMWVIDETSDRAGHIRWDDISSSRWKVISRGEQQDD